MRLSEGNPLKTCANPQALRPRWPARNQVLGLRPKIGNEIGPEIGPASKIGKKKQPKNRKSGENPVFGAIFALFSGRHLFPDLFRFLFWAKGPKPIF